jgi:chemotaxis protein methyltransferase CheR
VYLEPEFVLAHFALGTLARGRARHRDADRHFVNTLQLLGRLSPHDVLPESEGLTAGRLDETITALTSSGHRR